MPEIRKAFRQGNALVISIPAAFVAGQGIRSGDYFSWAVLPSGDLLIARVTKSVIPPAPEVAPRKRSGV